ncbi:MAG: peptidase domain-containing ABC transporter [Pseudomonadota bacterium]
MRNSVSLEFGRQKMPSLLQTEVAECGLACLAMVACHHGFHTDLPALRARFSVSLQGADMGHIADFAERIKLTPRPLRLEVDEMRELKTPCILHWDLNHFVVLKSVHSKHITIHDPAVGVRRLSYAEVGKHFTGVALELTPAMDFKCVEEQRHVSLTSLIGSVQGLWQSFSLVLIMALALEAFALLTPMFNQWVVDEALVSADRGMLNVLALGSLLLMLTQAAVSQARSWTIMYLSTHLNLQWIGNVFNHLLHLPLVWFEKRHLGDVVSRFGSVRAIQRTITNGFIGAMLDGLMAIATFVMMLFYSPLLSLVVILTVILYALLRTVAYLPLREASTEGLFLAAKEQTCFLETIRAIQAIRLYGREKDRRNRWLSLMVDVMNRGVRTQKLGMLFSNANLIITGTSGTLMLWLGAGMVMDGVFTIGMMFAFTAYGTQFGARMSSLIDNLIEFRMLSLHTGRLADIVLEPPEADVPNDGSVARLESRIELIDVGFRYSENGPWIVRHLNLVIEPGDSVAIVGPSGGGKTTLIKLILSVLAPTEGEIRYGGVPIRQIGASTYRSAALAVVMQDDQLLTGSLADNISFFDQQVDMEQVQQCARMAAIHSDIEAMPMGYSTLTGDMGTTLSGGQKQRILFARALYKKPKVLILDEATSHMDVKLERAVNASIASLSITRIIVAHRPETIASAKRVLALVGGSFVQDLRVPDGTS